MEDATQYPPSIRLVAMAWGIKPSEVVPMFVSWRTVDGLTYEQMRDRLREKNPQAVPSVQRLSEWVVSHLRAKRELEEVGQ